MSAYELYEASMIPAAVACITVVDTVLPNLILGFIRVTCTKTERSLTFSANGRGIRRDVIKTHFMTDKSNAPTVVLSFFRDKFDRYSERVQ